MVRHRAHRRRTGARHHHAGRLCAGLGAAAAHAVRPPRLCHRRQ
ncbi:secreted protein [marine sediment metagenome]|uniref:Secreted protein n=1 Tax=marine sediment metagenome TaxID=412755 RepID=A0A1B6NUY6_9ZZZZ